MSLCHLIGQEDKLLMALAISTEAIRGQSEYRCSKTSPTYDEYNAYFLRNSEKHPDLKKRYKNREKRARSLALNQPYIFGTSRPIPIASSEA